MDEQSRAESAADTHAHEPDEAVSAATPSEPIGTPSASAELDATPAARPDAWADLRIHPWQVLSADSIEPVPNAGPNPTEDATPASADPQVAHGAQVEDPTDESTSMLLTDEQGADDSSESRWAILPDEAALATVRLFADHNPDVPVGESTPAAPLDTLESPTMLGEQHFSAPVEEQATPLEDLFTAPAEEQATPVGEPPAAALFEVRDTIEVYEEQVATSPTGEIIVVARRALEGTDASLAHVERPQAPQASEAPFAWTPAPTPAPTRAVAGGAADSLALFTAATVPPGEPAGGPFSDLPRIPVDPSAETVPLSTRTDEIVPTGHAYPGYPGYPGSPQANQTAKRQARVRQPLSRDVVMRFLTAACGTIVLAAMLGLLFTQGEWATGMAAAAIAALLVAVAYFAATIWRVSTAERKGNTLRLGLTATAIFGLLGGVGLAFSGSLHQVQAGVLASVGDFGGAVREYKLAGDVPPNPDLARAYIGWGNELLRKGDFAGAAGSFQVIVEQFTHTSFASDGGHGLLRAYAGWLPRGGASLPYDTIIRDLGTVGGAAYCDSSCAATAASLSAQAHVDYGVALNGRHSFQLAIAQFEIVTRAYSTSSLAPAAHEDAAVTYFVYGETQRASNACIDAVPTFQRLASGYADTTEGAAAKAALGAPVHVSGVLTGYPKNPMPIMYLSKTIRGDSFFSDDYAAKVDASGKFLFSGVAPGSYNLSAAVPNGSGVYWVDPNTHNPYNIAVGPLCDLSLQSYPYA